MIFFPTTAVVFAHVPMLVDIGGVMKTDRFIKRETLAIDISPLIVFHNGSIQNNCRQQC